MKLGVVLPSRGLIFSETLQELLEELDSYGGDYEIFWSHERSLPDCFNIPTEEALKDKNVFAVLYVEDDMIIPKGVLNEMFAQKYPSVALQYPFKGDGDSTLLHDPQGMAFFSGTGFLLVSRNLLLQMERPIWRTDRTFDMFIDRDTIHWWPRKLDRIFYGLHDLNFGLVLYSSGVPIKPLERSAGQRKLVKLGKSGSNGGQHDIKRLTVVGRDLVSGQVDPENAEMFLGAMNRVKYAKVWTEKPPFIDYVDDQPVLNDGRDYERVR